MRKAIAQIFSGNVVSKVLGLVREVLTAALFGTGQAIGAFRIAQTGTLSPINFFTGDSLNAAFIPLYKSLRSTSVDQAQTLFWSICGLFGVLALALGTALFLGAAPWISVLAPGLEPDTAMMAVAMLKIMGLGVPFYLMSAILMFLSMAHEDFIPMAVRPTVQNVGLIVGTIAAFWLSDFTFFAWGFTASYVAFSIWIVNRSWRAGTVALPTLWIWPQVGQVMAAFWVTLRPLLLLPVMLQGNIVVERAVASLIGLVAISALDYARFVTETLVLLLSVPVAFTGLVLWSGLDHSAIRQRLHKVILLMLIAAVPLSAFLALNAHTVVRALYERGAFDAASVQITGNILFGAALGLWAQVIAYVLIKALNAQMRNTAVLWVMSLSLGANIAFNLLMHPYLGAMTLGLGNSIYGLILLLATMTVLQLWRKNLRGLLVMAIGAAGYLVVAGQLPQSEHLVNHLIMAGGFALVYWAVWVASVPMLRRAVTEAVAPKARQII